MLEFGGVSMEGENFSFAASWKPTSVIRVLILRDKLLVGRAAVVGEGLGRAGDRTGILEAGPFVAEVGD